MNAWYTLSLRSPRVAAFITAGAIILTVALTTLLLLAQAAEIEAQEERFRHMKGDLDECETLRARIESKEVKP